MESKKYLDDLSSIKDLMSRSSRFISLSGLSGIMAGIYALTGAAITYLFLLPEPGEYITLHSWNFKIIIAILMGVVILSVTTAYLLTAKKAKKNDEKIWDNTTKRLLTSFLVPLAAGGIYILIKLSSQHYGLTGSLMLIFYGLALINASKYTLSNIQYLGYAELILGLICAAFPGFGFWFWIIGFGFFHIIYGSLIYLKEEKS
ncbi:hypothetical protein [Maribacter sp. 2210JD10-5]|uniref:hypothetical protein n=1 Tax=Maribacter sp. 2210JD10-5 TaxID=3386272 RepID=UPI0039BC9FEA